MALVLWQVNKLAFGVSGCIQAVVNRGVSMIQLQEIEQSHTHSKTVRFSKIACGYHTRNVKKNQLETFQGEVD